MNGAVQIFEALGSGGGAAIFVDLTRRVASRRSRKAAEAKRDVRADAEAYDRARQINREIVGDLEAQIERLRTETKELRSALARSESRNQELETRVQHLEETGAVLARKVQQLRARMTEYNVPLPQDF